MCQGLAKDRKLSCYAPCGVVFQRIGASTRMGGPDKIMLERYVEVLEDPASGLTYPALTSQESSLSEMLSISFALNYLILW